MVVKIKSEKEMSKWFEKNFRKLGYSRIIKDNRGRFPDFIMERKGKIVRVELELLASSFVLHNHPSEGADEVVCIDKNIKLDIPIVIAKELVYTPRLKRISATVERSTIELINQIMKKGNHRNKSHVIEDAIKFFEEKNEK